MSTTMVPELDHLLEEWERAEPGVLNAPLADALEEAGKLELATLVRHGAGALHSITCHFRGVPTFFRACCREASRGGSGTYRHAGYHLASSVESLLKYEDEIDQIVKIGVLREALCEEQDGAVLAWFDREFPRCMALVPARRRAVFAQGVADAFDERRV